MQRLRLGDGCPWHQPHSGPGRVSRLARARRVVWRKVCTGGGADGGGNTAEAPAPAATGGSPSVEELLSKLAAAQEVRLSRRQRSLLRAGAAGDAAGGSGSDEPRKRRQRAASPPPTREPRLPPLPYWCEAVAVVGLPDDQLVFRFQTPTEAAAAARRQLRVEGHYGAAAVKLATLPGRKVQAILDRWQYACAQRELAELDARPPLWWRYESAAGAHRQEGVGPPAAANVGAAQRQRAEERGTSLEQQRAVTLSRQQRKQAAKLERQLAAEERRRQRRAGRRAGRRDIVSLAPSAAQADWEVCTVRGLPDGSLIFKYGGFEPLPGDADPDSGSDGDGGRQGGAGASRPTRRLLLLQQSQRTQEGVAWSHALRLGARFQDTATRATSKLQTIAGSMQRGQRSDVALTTQLFPSYAEAAMKLEKRLRRLEEEAAAEEREAEASGWQRQQGEGTQQQQAKRRQQQPSPAPAAERAWQAAAPTEPAAQRATEQEEEQRAGAGKILSSSDKPGGVSELSDRAWAAAGDDEQQQQQQKPNVAAKPAWSEALADEARPPKRQERRRGAGGAAGRLAADGQAAPGEQRPGRLAALAALVWLAPRAAARLARLLAAAAAAACLAAYRRLLPVRLRRLFWRSWPPRVEAAHVSPGLAALIQPGGSLGSAALAAAGFDSQGRTEAPLVDLPAWRVEALTLYRVRDISLYRTAFTHKSALSPALRLEKSYERLEFLGDSVLGLTTRALLMQRCPDSDEGDMTRLNSVLVSGAANARDGLQHKPGLLADAFEALLGALYLDRGFDAAQRFCMRVLEACVDWSELEAARDYKSQLCRYAGTRQVPQPRFSVQRLGLREYKAGLQLPWWRASVHLLGREMGAGGSFDRRDAEQAAARAALEELGELPAA